MVTFLVVQSLLLHLDDIRPTIYQYAVLIEAPVLLHKSSIMAMRSLRSSPKTLIFIISCAFKLVITSFITDSVTPLSPIITTGFKSCAKPFKYLPLFYTQLHNYSYFFLETNYFLHHNVDPACAGMTYYCLYN